MPSITFAVSSPQTPSQRPGVAQICSKMNRCLNRIDKIFTAVAQDLKPRVLRAMTCRARDTAVVPKEASLQSGMVGACQGAVSVLGLRQLGL